MKCAFKGPRLSDLADRYRDYQCNQEAEFGSLCIFHIEKSQLANASDVEIGRHVRRCEAEFASLLEKSLKDPKITKCDFRGFQLSSLNLSQTVSKELDFRDAQFDFVSLDGAEFLGSVDFSNCKFRDMASFACTFGEPVHFSSAEFSYPPFFVEAKFLSSAKFWGTKLKSPWFKNANFSSVDFSMAEIEGKAVFDEATFSSPAHFWHTKFNGDASFSKVVFNSASTFSSSIFSALADFRETQFGVMSDFNKVTFLGRVRFQRSVFKDVSFKALDLGKDSDLVFESVSLQKASFTDTNIEQIRFRDVDWCRIARSGFLDRARSALGDEFRSTSSKADFERIAENYRQLVLAYERKRDFEVADDFHIGEMEMRRKKKGVGIKSNWWRAVRGWTNGFGIYRLSSNYGTSYSQASAVLVLLVLLLSMAFLYAGFRPIQREGSEPTLPIEYNLLSDYQHRSTNFPQWLRDYGSAISLSFSIITFQKDRFYEPLEGWSRFWLYVGVVVLTAQGALVLLAIRRRFRR